MGIDGPTLLELDTEDIQKELKVSSNIVMKKLMKWISEYLPQYDLFLEEKRRGGLQEEELLVNKINKQLAGHLSKVSIA